MRLLILALLIATCGLVASAGLDGGGSRALADTPHPGLDFSIGADWDGDGFDDCSSTGVPFSLCRMAAGKEFAVSLYLNNSGLPAYFLYRAELSYSGVYHKSLVVQTWPDCDGPFVLGFTPTVVFACATAPSTLSTYTGKLAEVVFTCGGFGGTISLIHGVSGWRTTIGDADANLHAEGEGTTESIDFICDPPTPTPLPNPCSSSLPGDADGDGDRDAIDGMFVLQYVAGLRSSLRCPSNANVDGGAITATDGSLILQAVAGLISL